jgi:hypothetical protein
MVVALALLPLGACGGGDGDDFFDFFFGPDVFALPVFNDGASKTLMLRNISDQDAPVRIRAIPFGTITDVVIPARGQLRLPVASFSLPGDEGFLIVDSHDPTTGNPIATTGLVEPFIYSVRTGPDCETIYGAVLHSQKALVPIFELTDRVLFVNDTAVAGTFDVLQYGATDGIQPVLLDTTPVFVPANSYTSIDFSAIASQAGVGHIRVNPPAGGYRFSLAAHQDQDLVHDVDDAVRGDARLLNQGGTSQAMMQFQYGRDNATGGFFDFHILVSNPTDQDSAFSVNWIRDEFGNPIKTTPRLLLLGPNQTRLIATTTNLSRGFQVGEINPIAEHFGDVFLATSLLTFHMNVSTGNNLIVSGVQFDPGSLAFQSSVRPTAIRRAYSVLTHDLQSSLASATENWAWLSNPTDSPIDVQVRAFTRGDQGITDATEYMLPSFTIPPFSIYRFRADGLGLTEIPNDPVGTDVPDVRFLFTSNAAYGIRGVRIQLDTSTGQIAQMSPFFIRAEEDDDL